MRASRLLRRLLGIEHVLVSAVDVVAGFVVADVKPSWLRPRCCRCGRKARSWRVASADRLWRHLDLCGVMLFLRYDRKQLWCRRCGWVVERVPWADEPRARFTRDFDDLVAFLAQRQDKTAITELLRISWRTVGRCIERVVRRLRPSDPLADLKTIGVDELSYRKHHHYLTLVTDHDRRAIVWGKEGKNAATLKAFFDELGPERSARLETATLDLGAAYISAIKAAAPHVELVFDRFHVQRLVADAVDRTRREEWQRLRRFPQEASALKKSRWALLKREENLTEDERGKLTQIQQDNKRLYRAYLLKEQFVDILNRRQPNVVRRLLEEWLSWASRSRLPGLVKAGRTIRQHLDGIVRYIRTRLSNGLAEGLNAKARLLTRRAYGFHSADAAIAMIMLCCSGLDVRPPLKQVS